MQHNKEQHKKKGTGHSELFNTLELNKDALDKIIKQK